MQALTGKRPYLPMRLPPVHPHAGKPVCCGYRLKRISRHIGPPHDISKAVKGWPSLLLLAAGGNTLSLAAGQPLDQTQAKTQCMMTSPILRVWFQRTVPCRMPDIDRTHLNAAALCFGNQLGR